MTVDAIDLAFKERVCDATNRIPTCRWPFYGTTLKATIAEGDTTATLTFEAERDTLFYDMSISVTDEDDVDLDAFIDLEYCNVTIADHVLTREWAYCCDRKGWFLMGIPENKRARFVVTLAAAAPAGGAFVEISLNGAQGDGCCSS
jgi:hypothetical protein